MISNDAHTHNRPDDTLENARKPLYPQKVQKTPNNTTIPTSLTSTPSMNSQKHVIRARRVNASTSYLPHKHRNWIRQARTCKDVTVLPLQYVLSFLLKLVPVNDKKSRAPSFAHDRCRDCARVRAHSIALVAVARGHPHTSTAVFAHPTLSARRSPAFGRLYGRHLLSRPLPALCPTFLRFVWGFKDTVGRLLSRLVHRPH